MILIINQNKEALHKAQLHMSEMSSVWENPHEFELQDFLILLKNIGEESLKHGRIYSQYFIDEIKEKMVDLDICPECGEELSHGVEKEKHTELDYPAYEYFDVKICNNCRFQED